MRRAACLAAGPAAAGKTGIVPAVAKTAPGMRMDEIISVRRLGKGQRAIISGINAEGEMGRRIRDMGLIPGVEVQCVGRAPLKDPVALRLLGFTLTLRNREADYIEVKV